MLSRMRAFLTIALIAAATSATGALAQQAPAQADPNIPTLNEPYGDWSVRCFNLRGPAPCYMIQVAVNKQNQQPVIVVSIAYVPEPNAFRTQIIVPLGVALSKGLTLNAGDHTLKGAHFNRCNRAGCYVEGMIDNDTVAALAKVGQATTMDIVFYGKTVVTKLPLSLKGFTAAVARLRVVATQRATRTQQSAPAPAPAAPTPAPHVPVTHAPVTPTPAPGH